MKGPLEKGHYPTIPENTEVLDVTIADRVCYVAFDRVFSSYALDVSENIPVYSVVNSLLDAVEADKVQITVGTLVRKWRCIVSMNEMTSWSLKNER